MISVITKITTNPLAKHKVHLGDHKATGGIRPLCGGGRDGRSVAAWNTDFGGLQALNCKRCIKMLVKMLLLKSK